MLSVPLHHFRLIASTLSSGEQELPPHRGLTLGTLLLDQDRLRNINSVANG